MQKAVEKLVRELNEESMIRRGMERDANMGKIEADLARARAFIKDAIFKSRHSLNLNLTQDVDYVPRGEIYRNSYVFQRSYMLMEKMFKIYVYEEGDPPLFHYGPSKDIYSTEGIFLGLIESNSHFKTRDPNRAHLYFLPFSVVMILQHLFDPIQRDKAVLERVIGDYVAIVSTKYPYWNRSLGADHFMLSCHDWGPRATWYVHHLYFTSIRALCNANTSEFFNPRKDVSFPEINLREGNISGLTTPGSRNRTVLAFFAGRLHGKIRPSIFKHWKDKDNNIMVLEQMPENSNISYKEMMERSKFCLCPSGYEVASPRVVEAIYSECVPVLISEDYVLPFSDVLDWDKFSVRVSVDELQELKRILMGIGDDGYEALRRGVRQNYSLAFFSSNSSSGNTSADHGHESSYNTEQERIEKSEAILAKARSSIREAAGNKVDDDHDEYIPQGPAYWNANAFLRSYKEMERVFKIYVYEEGELPIFHNGPCRSIYSTEGNLIYEMERNGFYRTRDAMEAHVFFLPFSVVGIVQYLYEPGSNDRDAIAEVVADYVQMISVRHPFWNSSRGADHFMLSCHDWGPFSTRSVPNLFKNSIRVLCNANTSEGFNPLKDASLPEINLKAGEEETEGVLGGAPPLQRPFLAFFAGRLHGHIRHLLLGQWKGKDPEIQVYDELPTNVSYESMLRSSRFCLCPSGYEVASPRVVEAIYSGCIPVLISDGYVPPLSDVLNWSEFSLVIEVENIMNIRKILMGVPEEKHLRMYERLRQVQRHFVMNGPPKRFDLFHMIVHSIWLRRLNVRIRNM
ncbi:glycosyltransferase [Perilla frutescens var. frutescens]|nr:glycosyltransferase [Perilla frutescens var. frutescens]